MTALRIIFTPRLNAFDGLALVLVVNSAETLGWWGIPLLALACAVSGLGEAFLGREARDA